MGQRFMALVLVFGLLAGSAAAALAQGIVPVGGTYDVHGTNRNGSQYTGTVVIAPKNHRYRFSWLIADGTTYRGWGTRKGNRIVVNWGARYPVIYTIGPDGVLNGTWDNGRAKETLLPQP